MTSLQCALLEKEANKRTVRMHFKIRINLLLKAKKGESNSEVARDLAISLNTVKTWRRRWQEKYEQLCAYEKEMGPQGLSEHNYLQEMLGHLQDNPRSGTRKRITLEQEQQIVALASENPRDYGVEVNSWTHERLAEAVISQGIVDKISSRHIGNILKKTNYSPTNRRTGYSPKSRTGKHSL